MAEGVGRVVKRRRQGLVEGEKSETKGLCKEIKGRRRDMRKMRHEDIKKDKEKTSVERKREVKWKRQRQVDAQRKERDEEEEEETRIGMEKKARVKC